MWVFNVWLFMMWVQAVSGNNPTGYATWVASGQPCYAYNASLADPQFPQDPAIQPVCWYDPANTNPGVPSK